MRAKPVFQLSLLASALALALPAPVSALGLGKLNVHSALGQPLSAQIELTSAARDEIESLSAKVADPALYRQNNLTFQGVLSRARVTLERNAGGEPYLRVVTTGPVNEPYLDLMVELNWASGRVVREYTFLLDPPGVAAPTPAIEPVTPVRAGSAAPRATASATRAPAATTAPAAAPAVPTGTATSGGTGLSSSGQTYTVRRGETLGHIAARTKPASASLEQMLVALFRSNPDAFDGNNMNRLRSGTIVTIPTAEEVAATPATEATRVVHVQATDWRSYRDRVAAGAPASEAAGGRSAGGRIGTAVTEATPAAPAGSDQVRISREAGQSRGSAAAAEDAVARDRALKDAQNRIAELEKTLKDLQRAVEVRNQTMAQLSNQADSTVRARNGEPAKATPPAAITPPTPAKAPEVRPVEPLKAPEPAKAPAAVRAEPPKSEPAKVETAKVEPAKASADKAEGATVVVPSPSATGEAPKSATPPESSTTTSSSSRTTSTTTTPAPSSTTTTIRTVDKTAPKPEPSFVDDFLNNTPSWAIGAGALAVLGGIAALVAARRKRTTKFEDSIISGTDIKTNTVFGSTGGGVVNTGENSLSSDFSREGLSNIDTDEVDPIAEAEVYLAYGRDAQAEEILKDALKKDPQRQEIYLKLLEIHAQHNKPSAFETVAAELYAVSQGQGEVWHKAVALGRQLDPNNPMYAEGGPGAATGTGAATTVAAAGALAAGAAALHAHAASGENLAGHELHLETPPEPGIPPPVPVGMAELDQERDHGLDLKLEDEISIAPTSGAKPKSPAEILAGAANELEKTARAHDHEHDVHGLHAGSPAPVPEPMVEPRFDLDFHLDEDEKPAPLRPQPSAPAPRPEPVLEGAGVAPAAPARPQAAIDLDKLDLSFDPDRATFEDPTPSVLDGQWHDAATKLDLAKAYQEMGDIEGAREILQEVLHEGDEAQRGEAKTLLAKLG